MFFMVLVSFCSCGSTTKAIIKNSSTGTSTTISITTNNPTNWEVNPNTPIDLNFPKKND